MCFDVFCVTLKYVDVITGGGWVTRLLHVALTFFLRGVCGVILTFAVGAREDVLAVTRLLMFASRGTNRVLGGVPGRGVDVRCGS